jgi:hypothetical protein
MPELASTKASNAQVKQLASSTRKTGTHSQDKEANEIPEIQSS